MGGGSIYSGPNRTLFCLSAGLPWQGDRAEQCAAKCFTGRRKDREARGEIEKIKCEDKDAQK